MRELYPALLLGASTRVEMSVGSCGIRIADVCVFSCASRSQASPMLILRRFQKNGEVPSFQEDTLSGVRISCRPHGYDLLRCPCRCPRRFNPLRRFRYRHHVGRLTRASGLWCSCNSPLRSQGLGTLVVTVPCDFVARQTTAALLFVTLLSRLISSPVRLLTRYLLHLSYDWSLCLAQLTPACGVTSFRFVRAATALPVISILSLCRLRWLWVRVILCCFLSCLLRSLNRYFSMS